MLAVRLKVPAHPSTCLDVLPRIGGVAWLCTHAPVHVSARVFFAAIRVPAAHLRSMLNRCARMLVMSVYDDAIHVLQAASTMCCRRILWK